MRLAVLLLLVSLCCAKDDAGIIEQLASIEFERSPSLEALLADGATLAPKLLRVASSDDAALRDRAIYVLGEMRPPSKRVTQLIAAYLLSDDRNARYVAATAVAKLAPNTPDYIPWLLLARVHAQPWPARSDAVRVFDSIEESIGSRLISALRHREPEVRLRAFVCLYCMDKSKLGLHSTLLQRQFAKSVAKGPTAILRARVEPGQRDLLPAIRATVGDAESRYADAAINTLRTLDVRDTETVTALLGALENESQHIKSLAAALLGNWQLEADRTVPALIKQVKNTRGGARSAAAYALTRFPKHATQITPVLVAALHERYSVTEHGVERARTGRGWAAAALGRLRAKDAADDLVRALDYNGFTVWRSAVEALGEIGPAANSAVPALVRVVEYQPWAGSFERFREYMDGDVRSKAIVALGKIGPAARTASPLLEDLAKDGNEQAREALRRIRAE